MGRDAGRDRQETDLGGGVEAETEEDAERIHLPARVDLVADALEEEAAHQPLVLECFFELLLVVDALLHLAEHPEHVEQHDQIEKTDQEQEGAGDRCADVAADVLEARNLRIDGLRRDRQARGEREDDRRVAKREEEADTHRAFAVLQQLARGVVDRRNVIGVEGMPKTEGVGQRSEPRERRVMAGVIDE